VIEQHLGLAEEEVSRVGQREVESPDDIGLRFRVEIHQRVPGHQEVDPRYGRVSREIVPSEDHLSP
jgi:hypothetical protein